MNYLQQRWEMKLKGKKPAAVVKAEKKEKSKFFKEAIAQAPSRCQECGKPLAGTMAINPAAVVAHILAKRSADRGGCPSVATYPKNTIYLCGDCHTDYDNKIKPLEQMKCLQRMQKAVTEMWHLIPNSERKNVPEILRPKK